MQATVQPAGWQEHNASGLLHAQSSCWAEATSSFELAAAGVSADEPDDVRALLLGNLATAHFHAGDIDAALAAARASLEVRARIWGVNAIATLRAKSDLATIHCARGEHDIAHALLADVITAVVRDAGEESHYLVPFVENAARAAIAAGDLARAEPLVLQLHGLLDLHQLPVEEADSLFRFVIEARSESTSSNVPVMPVVEAAAPDAVLEIAADLESNTPVESVAEAVDAEPVRAEAVDAEAVNAEDTTAVAEPIESHTEIAVGKTDEMVVFTTSEFAVDANAAATMHVNDTLPDDASPVVPNAVASPGDLDLTDAFTTLELVEPPPPTLDHVPAHRLNVHRDDNSLGFLVQHGTTVTPDEPFDVLSGPIGPLPELARPVEVPPTPDVAGNARMSGNRAAIESKPEADRPLRVTQPMALQTRGVQVRRPTRDVPVVLPSPARGSVSISEFAESDESMAPRNSLRVSTVSSSTAAESAPAARPVLLDHPRVRASGGARVWLVVGGGLATVIAAVGWYLAR